VPHYELVSGWELATYAVLGVVTGLVAIVFVGSLFGTQDVFEKLPLPRWLKPALGMALLGGLGIWWPHVYGNGFEAVNLALREQLPLALLGTLLVVKIAATSVTFGAGNAGGLFTPSLMVGALTGGVFGWGVHTVFPHITAVEGAYALVGMGGLLAGVTHAPLTAIMMIFEQTNSYQIILPLMLVCVISHVTVRVLGAPSMDEESLRRRGVKLPRGPEGSVMQSLRVADVMHEDVQSVNDALPFAGVVEVFLKEPYSNLYVVNTEGRFLGAIRLHALKEMLHQSEALTTVVAHDLLDDTFQFVTTEDTLSDTMDKFWGEHAERLPVVNNATDRRLVGWVSKRDLIGVYSQEILRKRQLLGRFIVTDGDEKREVFVELPEGFELRTIEIPAHVHGRTLAQLAPRSKFGVNVMAVKRLDPTTGRDRVEMPSADLQFAPGDRLVVTGTFDGIAHFMAALAMGIENDAS
jgi:CIC family chloride channel protein